MTGEFITMTGDGFTADFDPSITVEQFVDAVKQMDDMLFGEAARGLMITVTAYSVRSDWWTCNMALYEYGINGQV